MQNPLKFISLAVMISKTIGGFAQPKESKPREQGAREKGEGIPGRQQGKVVRSAGWEARHQPRVKQVEGHRRDLFKLTDWLM